MSLLTQAMEDVVMLEKRRVPDGEGGFTAEWADGVQFKAAINCKTSSTASGYLPLAIRLFRISFRQFTTTLRSKSSYTM